MKEMKDVGAARIANFTTSVFAEMSRLAVEHGAINLGQGFPDFDGPEVVKEAALQALRAGENQYAMSAGQPALRQAIAAHTRRWYGQAVDPESEVTEGGPAIETGVARFTYTVTVAYDLR